MMSLEDVQNKCSLISETHKYLLSGSIDQDMMEEVFYISAMNKESDIEVFVASDGGNVYYMALILEILNRNENFSTIIAGGPCMSSAAYLVALFERKRLIFPTSRMLFHQCFYGTEYIARNIGELEQDTNDLKLDNRWMIERLSKLMGKSVDELWTHMVINAKDLRYASQECVDLNLVDGMY